MTRLAAMRQFNLARTGNPSEDTRGDALERASRAASFFAATEADGSHVSAILLLSFFSLPGTAGVRGWFDGTLR